SRPDQTWDEHLRFARAAAAYKIQYLGNESGLPTCADIEAVRRKFGEPP
ncbi:MAG: sugar kinase, partial [Alphaproteobacteria bacterium]|nr:sugar kinase [Alphaproteobacteria bacterium]